MANGRGGYRQPSNPAPVSGPGALSKRTDGGAVEGMTQAPKYMAGMRYGMGGNKEQLILQSSWNAGSLGYCTAVLVSGNLNPNLDRRYALQIAKSAAYAVFFNACANYDE